MAREMKETLWGRIQLALVPGLILLAYRALLFCMRRVEIGREHRDALQLRNAPRIYAAWHENVFFGPALSDGETAAALVSSRGAGEIFDRVVRRLGHVTVRGSSSRRGAGALRELVRHLRANGAAGIVPDGPRGPALRVKEGIVIAASLSGAAVMPTHFECTRQWSRKKSWDKQRIPLPFSVVVCSYGRPVLVPPKLNDREMEEYRRRVEEAMLANREACRREAERLRRGEGRSRARHAKSFP